MRMTTNSESPRFVFALLGVIYSLLLPAVTMLRTPWLVVLLFLPFCWFVYPKRKEIFTISVASVIGGAFYLLGMLAIVSYLFRWRI